MVTAVPILFLVLSTVSRSESQNLQQYKACLMECFNCVQTYGKNFYNGKLCAENCAVTHGKSIDAKCYPPEKRGGGSGRHRSSSTQECVGQCQSACASGGRLNARLHGVDSYSCVFTCILSNNRIVRC